MRSTLITLALVLCLWARPAIADPLADLPRGHWAYGAVRAAVDAGILKGVDGKFLGERPLSRYEMAVIVGRILRAIDGAPSGPRLALVRSYAEALKMEFAEELELLDRKVDSLSGDVEGLRAEVEDLKAMGAPKLRPFTLHGHTSLAFVWRDRMYGRTPYSYIAVGEPKFFFTLPMTSLYVKGEVGRGDTFLMQVNYESDVQARWPGSTIDRVFVDVDHFLGTPLAARVGGFTLPFSPEHMGDLAQTRYVVTPAFANNAWRTSHVYGLELGTRRRGRSHGRRPAFYAALLSGTDDPPNILDDPTAPLEHRALEIRSSGPKGETGSLRWAREQDGNFGSYAVCEHLPERGRRALGWRLVYFDNGGDLADGSTPFDARQVELHYASGDATAFVQWIEGRQGWATGEEDMSDVVLFIDVEIAPRHSVSFRYENYGHRQSPTRGGAFTSIDGIAFVWNRQLRNDALLQLELLSVLDPPRPGLQDDVCQLRYRLWF